MADVIIEELWKIKDSIAQEHGYNLDSLVAHLKAQELLSGMKTFEPDNSRWTSDFSGRVK